MNEKSLKRALDYIGGWLRYKYERKDIPGAVVTVAHKGKILFNEAYGYADLEKKTRMRPDSIFRIASHSKTFTATAIMQLQEQGKLKIDEPAAKYIPWLEDHKDKRFANVTIRQLLSHGAGVIRDGNNSEYWDLKRPFPNREQFKREILDADLVIDSNTKMKYSNFGFGLLGLVVESASGQAYNDYVTKNIVKQLGLKNTGPELIDSIESRLVTGYAEVMPNKKRLPIAQINTAALSPATGFYSTGEDLVKYFTAHIVGSGKLLSDKSKREMQKKHWRAQNVKKREEYGLGLEIEYINNHKWFGHGGGFPGHNTGSLVDPKRELVVVDMHNAIKSGASYANQSIIKVIDYFQANDKATGAEMRKFEGRFMGLWRAVDMVAMGNKLLPVYPDYWEPFDDPDELEHISGNTFKVSKTSSFDAVDEPVEFNLDSNGRVESVDYAGDRQLLPEEVYMRQLAAKNRIG